METIKLGLPIFFSKTVALRAFKVSIVGIILAFINHGNLIFFRKYYNGMLGKNDYHLFCYLYCIFSDSDIKYFRKQKMIE